MRHILIPREQRPFFPNEVLAYFDGPLVFWLPVPEKRCLAIRLPAEAGPWAFLVSDMSNQTADALIARCVDLRQAVLSGENYLLADYAAEVLSLQPLPEVAEEWLPASNYLLNAR